MEELVGKVESAGPKVLTLRTQVSLKIMVVNGMKIFSLQSQVSKSKDDPRVVTLTKSAISL